MGNNYYAAKIKAVMEANGRYNDGMRLLIDSTATSLATLRLCRQELAGLKSTTITEPTRYGTKLVPHPVFRTLRDAQTVLLKNCKALGLSYKEISQITDEEDDPYNSFLKGMGRKDEE